MRGADEIYRSLDGLVVSLREAGYSKLAATIQYRLHKIAWTTRSELFEELEVVLGRALASDGAEMPEALKRRIAQILSAMRDNS